MGHFSIDPFLPVYTMDKSILRTKERIDRLLSKLNLSKSLSQENDSFRENVSMSCLSHEAVPV